MYCSSCGSEIDEATGACPSCGASVKASAPPTGPSPSTAENPGADGSAEKTSILNPADEAGEAAFDQAATTPMQAGGDAENLEQTQAVPRVDSGAVAGVPGAAYTAAEPAPTPSPALSSPRPAGPNPLVVALVAVVMCFAGATAAYVTYSALYLPSVQASQAKADANQDEAGGEDGTKSDSGTEAEADSADDQQADGSTDSETDQQADGGTQDGGAQTEEPSAQEIEEQRRSELVANAQAQGLDVYSGTMTIMSEDELWDYQGIANASGGYDNGPYALLIFDSSTTVNGLTADERRPVSQASTLICLGRESGASAWTAYNGQRITVAVNSSNVYWATDVSVPMGEPRTSSAQLLY